MPKVTYVLCKPLSRDSSYNISPRRPMTAHSNSHHDIPWECSKFFHDISWQLIPNFSMTSQDRYTKFLHGVLRQLILIYPGHCVTAQFKFRLIFADNTFSIFPWQFVNNVSVTCHKAYFQCPNGIRRQCLLVSRHSKFLQDIEPQLMTALPQQENHISPSECHMLSQCVL